MNNQANQANQANMEQATQAEATQAGHAAHAAHGQQHQYQQAPYQQAPHYQQHQPPQYQPANYPPNYHQAPPPYYAPPPHYAPPNYYQPQANPAGYYANPHNPMHNHPNYGLYNQVSSGLSSFLDFKDERFIKGAIVGAAATFLLTNESIQKNAVKSVVKIWSLFQGGVEEMKERFRDAEAELKSEEQHK